MSGRAGIVMALASLLLLTACGQQPDPGPDGPGGSDSAPEVETTVPSDGATDVPINSNVSVTFSDGMAQDSTEAAFGASPTISCDFLWNTGDTRVTCNPQSGLVADQSYSVTIGTGAEDKGGNALAAEESFSFTTGSMAAPECTFGSSEFGACVLAP